MKEKKIVVIKEYGYLKKGDVGVIKNDSGIEGYEKVYFDNYVLKRISKQEPCFTNPIIIPTTFIKF